MLFPSLSLYLWPVLIKFYKVFCWDILLSLSACRKAKWSSTRWPKHSSVLQRIQANFQSMTSSSILYTFYFAIVAWLYSSIGVLFLSDSVPELYNMFMTKCMWFTLMSGISLMCSRTPIVKSIAGLQAVVWSSQSVAEVVLYVKGR